jgi:hypothetical protein
MNTKTRARLISGYMINMFFLQQSIVWSDAIRAVLKMLAKGRSQCEGERQTKFEARMFDPNYTWLRVKNHGELTPEHGDIFYYLVRLI